MAKQRLSPDEAADKWQKKTLMHVEDWRKEVQKTEIEDKWKKGIKDFLGVEPSKDITDLFYQRVSSDTAYDNYKSHVSDPDAKRKWKENLVKGLTAKLS
ncbi:MAG: hypothetical protein ACP5I3_09040 [Thermoproteus sp.]